MLADGEQFVVAQGFELGLENIDHGHRMAESIEDFEVVTVFRAVSFVILHRGRHIAAAQTGTRQINRQSNYAVERKFHDSLGISVTKRVCLVDAIIAHMVFTRKVTPDGPVNRPVMPYLRPKANGPKSTASRGSNCSRMSDSKSSGFSSV